MSFLRHVFLTLFSDAHAYSQDVVTNPATTNPAATDPVATDPVDTDLMDTDPMVIDTIATDPVDNNPVDNNPAPTGSSDDLKFPVTIVNGKMKLNPPVDQRSALRGKSA